MLDQLRAFVVSEDRMKGIWIVENIADVGGLLCLKCPDATLARLIRPTGDDV